MFYEFSQNNSGGVFDVDTERGISHFVIVEADSIEEANEKAERIGLYFDSSRANDCSCCGSRWHELGDWDDPDTVPSYYGKPISESPWINAETSNKWIIEEVPEGYVHYKDGRVEGFWYSDMISWVPSQSQGILYGSMRL